ncbi:hypothetical protein WJX84_011776, partial [Apatococcus fuscideae]
MPSTDPDLEPQACHTDTLSVRSLYVSTGCSRTVGSLSWGQHGLVAYGSHNLVAIYSLQRGIVGTLKGHNAKVSCTTWLPSIEEAAYLASGSADHDIIIWRVMFDNGAVTWEGVAILKGHGGAVTSIALQQLPSDELLLVSTAGDSAVQVWTANLASGYGQPSWQLAQRIDVGFRMQLCATLASVQGCPGWAMLALGGVDGLIRLMVRSPLGDFQASCELKGHGDWVRSVAFTWAGPDSPQGERLLLASASQDKYIRVWAVSKDAAEGGLDGSKGVTNAGEPALAFLTRYAPRPELKLGEGTWSAALEALLVGHEDWVHGLAWQPPPSQKASHTSRPDPKPTLLSASMDRTMMLWRPDIATGLWLAEESVGDAGPTSLGYFGCAWSPQAEYIVSHGFTGALHLWRHSDSGWEPQHAAGGHLGAVTDLAWLPNLPCLLTVSTDQTARIFGPCALPETESLTNSSAADTHSDAAEGQRWCEIARPQIHGHDFRCTAIIPCPHEPGNF